MWRSKKFIVGTVLASVLLVGSIGGIVFAQTENGNDSQPGACHQALLEEACNILNDQGICTDITWEQLRDALRGAREAVADECQRPKRLGGQGEFGACREALLNKVCEIYGEGIDCEKLKAAFADVRSQMPDECQRPKRLGPGGHAGFRGMGGMRGFGGPFAPTK